MLDLLLNLVLAGHLSTEIGGIGAVVSHSTHGVSKIIKNSPADFGGLKEGDIILEADGHKGVKYITGEPYTYVHIKYKRGEDILEHDFIRFGMMEIYGGKYKNYKIVEGED